MMSAPLGPAARTDDGMRPVPLVAHQLILVGTNPIPGYVTARLLASPQASLYFLYLPEAEATVMRLCQRFESSRSVLPVPITDDCDVKKVVSDIVDRFPAGTGIGLNYNGGNKHLAVQACFAMQSIARDRGLGLVLSYLDGRTDKLIVEQNDERRFCLNVRLQPEPTLQELISLHVPLEETRKPGKTDRVLPGVAGVLAEAMGTLGFAERWDDWRRKLKAQARGDKAWRSQKTLAEISLESPPSEVGIALAGDMRASFTLADSPVAGAFGRRLEKCCEWIDGRWLEDHVLDVIQRLIQTGGCQVRDVTRGVKTAGNDTRIDFEVDIVAVQGCRLFVISCTTDRGMSPCKEKIFELDIRARELGGQEVSMGLVCCNGTPEKLVKQVRPPKHSSTRLRVFGAPQLPRLGDHLRDWFVAAASEGSSYD